MIEEAGNIAGSVAEIYEILVAANLTAPEA